MAWRGMGRQACEFADELRAKWGWVRRGTYVHHDTFALFNGHRRCFGEDGRCGGGGHTKHALLGRLGLKTREVVRHQRRHHACACVVCDAAVVAVSAVVDSLRRQPQRDVIVGCLKVLDGFLASGLRANDRTACRARARLAHVDELLRISSVWHRLAQSALLALFVACYLHDHPFEADVVTPHE